MLALTYRLGRGPPDRHTAGRLRRAHCQGRRRADRCRRTAPTRSSVADDARRGGGPAPEWPAHPALADYDAQPSHRGHPQAVFRGALTVEGVRYLVKSAVPCCDPAQPADRLTRPVPGVLSGSGGFHRFGAKNGKCPVAWPPQATEQPRGSWPAHR